MNKSKTRNTTLINPEKKYGIMNLIKKMGAMKTIMFS